MGFFQKRKIKKMKKKEDVEGLTQIVSKNDDTEARVLAAQALKKIGKKGINALSNSLKNTIKFGKTNDAIEAMIMMQGHVDHLERNSYYDLSMFLVSERIIPLRDLSVPIKLQYVQNLDEIIKEKDWQLIWFALLTLIELGDRREETLEKLIENSKKYIKLMDQKLTETKGGDYMLIANRVNFLIEQTIRALSYFRNSSKSREHLLKALDGEFLMGSYIHLNQDNPYLHVDKEDTICALGAVGDPNLKDRLEYIANRGNKDVQKTASTAIELYGKATYDEIKEKS